MKYMSNQYGAEFGAISYSNWYIQEVEKITIFQFSLNSQHFQFFYVFQNDMIYNIVDLILGLFGQYMVTPASEALFVINGRSRTVNCEIGSVYHPSATVWTTVKFY